ncbi:MAG: hypothetical protein EBT79_03425 [Actinobacteria bacterium]|nr:hypothetical protein [Actinomycetota bacterium]NBR66329.1 hypothetical protein [Actinomycetota bacterium]
MRLRRERRRGGGEGGAPAHCGKVVAVTRKHFLTYLSLSTVSVAQPVFDLYGKNLTVFSAGKLSRWEVLLFLLFFLLGPALGATAVDRFSSSFGPKVNEATRLVLIGLFSMLTGLAVARWVGVTSDAPYVLIAVVMTFLLPWAFDRWKGVREWSRWLAVLSLALGATTFVQLRPLIFPMAGTTADATVANDELSVFMVVMDEFPLFPLLGPDGTINAERWPGFAALAGDATWYRDALAVSNFTHQAVPAVLASSRPVPDGGPFLFSYPRNIFTLYADEMEVQGTEPVTSLCPKDVCGGESAFGTGMSTTRLRRFAKDVSIVYGQRVLPPTLRKRLPAVDQGWGGFAAVRDKFKQQLHDQVFSQRDAVVSGAEAFAASATPMVKVVHALIPHAPWRLTPDGRVAPLSPEIGTQNPEDEDGTRDTYQAFLHQLAATDAAIARAVDVIKASGKWDTTMFVLTADHGISFLPTLPQRNTDFTDLEQSEDIYRVPMFVKYPGQATGRTDDCPVTNLDILPTVNAVLGTESGWKFAGESLAADCPRTGGREVMSATGERHVFTTGFAAARDRAAYYAMLVPNSGPVSRIAAVGASADMVGLPISSATTSDLVRGWTLKQRDAFGAIDGRPGTTVPATVVGTVELSRPAVEGTEGIIAVDGIAAGVLGELSGQEGAVRFTAILDIARLGAGAHTVELFVRDENGTVTRVGPPA